jgi:FSR family fosmidomycin resistance protein-like MFS transporter
VRRAAITLGVPEQEKAGPERGRLALLSVGHGVTDSYGQSLIAPLYPEIRSRLNLSLAEVGGLPVMMGLTASLAQPLIGWLTDRYPRVCFVALGPLAAATVIGFLGHARGYWQLAALLFLAGLGIGAFHPQGASLAREAGRGSALAMSVFTVGGNVGFGLAPVLGVLYARWFGLEHFHLAALPAVVFALVMAATFYRTPPEAAGRAGRGKATGKGNPRALCALTATVVVRSAVQVGITTFLPFLVAARFPETARATVISGSLSAFLLASAVAGPVGGLLADRFGRRRLMAWSFLLAPWPLLLALRAPGLGLVALLAFGGFVLMLPHPGNVVLAQDLLPRRTGIAASLITGLAYGLAQILCVPLGSVADATSPQAALTGLCFLPLLGVLLLGPIPEAVGSACVASAGNADDGDVENLSTPRL